MPKTLDRAWINPSDRSAGVQESRGRMLGLVGYTRTEDALEKPTPDSKAVRQCIFSPSRRETGGHLNLTQLLALQEGSDFN